MNDRKQSIIALGDERWRFSFWLTGIMMAIYFGFILLIAYNKPLLGTLIMPGLSLGILFGALVIVAAWVLIYVYVRWANTYYDRKLSRLHQEAE